MSFGGALQLLAALLLSFAAVLSYSRWRRARSGALPLPPGVSPDRFRSAAVLFAMVAAINWAFLLLVD